MSEEMKLPSVVKFDGHLSFYTCIGKGGIYRVKDRAKGAGTSKETGSIVIYEDIDDPFSTLYYRTVEDFNNRMQEISLDDIQAKETNETKED